MKLLLPCLTFVFSASLLHAEDLNDSDRANALKWLTDYKEKMSSGTNKRINDAKNALKRASTDDMSALELYKNSIKKVQYDDNGKSSLDYIEWEKGQKELFANPGFKMGLKIQCRWILLGIIMGEAEKNKEQIAFPIGEISSVYSEITSNPQIIDAKGLVIGGPSGVIKKFLKVNDINSKNLPENPFEVGGMFDKIILPAIAKTKNVPDFRKAWLWRIDLEKQINIDPEIKEPQEGDDNNGQDRHGNKRDKRKSGGGITNARAGKKLSDLGNELNNKARLSRETKTMNKLSELRWKMERDCYNMGDQKASVAAMKAMILATTDPQLLDTRITDLSNILKGAEETTPAIGSAGDQDMSGTGIDWTISSDSKLPNPSSTDSANTAQKAASAAKPAQASPAAPAKPETEKPKGPMVIDGDTSQSGDATKSPAPAKKEQPAEQPASEDDWNL